MLWEFFFIFANTYKYRYKSFIRKVYSVWNNNYKICTYDKDTQKQTSKSYNKVVFITLLLVTNLYNIMPDS